MVTNDRLTIINARFACKTDRRRYTRVRNGNDQIGIDRSARDFASIEDNDWATRRVEAAAPQPAFRRLELEAA